MSRIRGLVLSTIMVIAAGPVVARAQSPGEKGEARTPLLAYARVRLPVIPVEAGSAAPPPYNYGSTPLAVGETLLGNFVPWLFNEYASRYKDITRISPSSWKRNVAEGLRWDDNHFHVNMLMHPYAGSLAFTGARSNDFNFEQSFFFSVLGSALWECCGESHHPSLGDLITTTAGGVALGEMLFRWTGQILNHANGQTPRNGWWEVPVAIMSPMRSFTRWTLGRFSAPNPPYVGPGIWAAYTASGAGSPGVFHETGYTYGDVLKVTRRARPFAHFESAVELDFGSVKQTIARIQARGSLWSDRYLSVSGACLVNTSAPPTQPGVPSVSNCNTHYINVVPYLGFDYINNDAYEFGGQSIGGAGFYTFGRYPGGFYGVVSIEGHIMFGGVQSEHAYLAQVHDADSERPREYDITWGPGFGISGTLRWSCLRGSVFTRFDRHWVLDGSSEAGPASHRTNLWGLSGRCRITGPLGIGTDYRHYHRASRYDSSLSPSAVTMDDGRLRVFVTLDRIRPLGLFVF